MKEINDGGPAFPLADPNKIDPVSISEYRRAARGISMRDYFAAKALPGFLATCEREPGGATSSLSAEAIARACYIHADAMIAEGSK